MTRSIAFSFCESQIGTPPALFWNVHHSFMRFGFVSICAGANPGNAQKTRQNHTCDEMFGENALKNGILAPSRRDHKKQQSSGALG